MHALKPWIVDAIMNSSNQEQTAAVLTRLIELNRREEIALAVQDSQTQENLDKAGFEGTVCDNQCSVKAVFSDEALSVDAEDDSQSQLDSLPGMYIILRKYSIFINQIMIQNRAEYQYMLYVEKFTTWGHGGHFNLDVMECNDLPHVRGMLREVQRNEWRNRDLQEETQVGSSTDRVDNISESQVSSSLTQLMELADVDEHLQADVTDVMNNNSEGVEEDDITERDITHLVIPSPQQSQLDHVIYDLSHLMIPQDQVDQLADLEEWKPDYVPPCSERSSVGSSYLEQAMGRDLPLQGTSPPDFYLKRDLSPGHSLHEADSDTMGDLYLKNPLDNQPSLLLSNEEDDEEDDDDDDELLWQAAGVHRSRNSQKHKLDSSQMSPLSRKTITSTNAPNTLSKVVTKKPIFKSGTKKKAPVLPKSQDLPSSIPTPPESHQPHKVRISMHFHIYTFRLQHWILVLTEADSVYPSQHALRQAILNLKYPRRQLKALISIYSNHH
ncbi:uncharacterized protein LOC144920763 [Branchiostoma floridae x Branchiostoma belcheri]